MVVPKTPSGTFGSVTTMVPSCMRTRAPGVCATTLPSRKPFARPSGSTTSELSDSAETVTTRCAAGAERGGSGAEFACTVVVWSGRTRTSLVAAASAVATRPSVVVTVVAPSSTMTSNAVPRTEAVAAGVFTS